MIGRTNAGGGGLKMVTGTVSALNYKQTGTDYTTDYWIIPASLIGFTPKILIVGRTDATIACVHSIDERLLYGDKLFNKAVYPDLAALYFSSSYVWKQSGTSTSVNYITINGTEYAYVPNAWNNANVVWFHEDGSIRFTKGRYTDDSSFGTIGYVVLG